MKKRPKSWVLASLCVATALAMLGGLFAVQRHAVFSARHADRRKVNLNDERRPEVAVEKTASPGAQIDRQSPGEVSTQEPVTIPTTIPAGEFRTGLERLAEVELRTALGNLARFA